MTFEKANVEDPIVNRLTAKENRSALSSIVFT
jgi:hypothetical protein